MNRFDFYKEFYFKELDSRNELNNSLSLPIGLITAFIAGLFYLVTNFNYTYSTLLTLLFLVSLAFGLGYLVASIYNLIKAYTDYPRGYTYSILADTNDIDSYYQELKKFYADSQQPDTTDKEFEEYILHEIIKNTGDNQKNNKRKNKFRYNCEKNLIASFMAICFSIPFFLGTYNFKPAKDNPIGVKAGQNALTNNPTSTLNSNFIAINKLNAKRS